MPAQTPAARYQIDRKSSTYHAVGATTHHGVWPGRTPAEALEAMLAHERLVWPGQPDAGTVADFDIRPALGN